ncbi:MAG: phosphopantothenoylcysteine decarboxylase, partial [Candidatus Omnitrophica bacterium]|nr:phosphopantothenoylcysteine decarboxylase [Candidatus Omnitrophota bacterium]
MNLKNKRVLVTAGPTWVPIDKVRVISNTASGETGILLAYKLRVKGARVTLLLGPVSSLYAQRLDKPIEIIRYRFFDELKRALEKELKSRRFDIIIHSAAVSDFKLARSFKGKIASGAQGLNLKLVPTQKLARLFKKIQPKAKLVIFKLELGVAKNTLLKRALKAKKEYRADLAVANTFINNKYRASIIDS